MSFRKIIVNTIIYLEFPILDFSVSFWVLVSDTSAQKLTPVPKS